MTLRDTILRNHLQNGRTRHLWEAKALATNLAVDFTHSPDQKDFLCGTAQEDVDRFTSLDPETQQLLENELSNTLQSLAIFYQGEDGSDHGLKLAHTLRLHLERMESDRAQIKHHRHRIEDLVKEIDQANLKLIETLTYAIQQALPKLHEHKSAEHEVLGATIEASILKLSLLRSKAHSDIYGRCGGELNVALAVMDERLGHEETKLAEEERELDAKLEEYGWLTELADLPGQRFGQVVEDWLQVKQGTEDCRRDLYRLGWTGD